jgi:hypothetical protein
VGAFSPPDARGRQLHPGELAQQREVDGNGPAAHAGLREERGGPVASPASLHRSFVRINGECGIDEMLVSMPHQAGASIFVASRSPSHR